MDILIQTITLIKNRWEFFQNLIIEHIVISLYSIFIATILGLALAIFISEYKKYAKLVISGVNFLYVIPSISMLGLLIPLSGIGDTTAIIALCLYALLPMVRSSYTGLTNIDQKILDAALAMGTSKLQMIYKIKLPLALPVIISAIKDMVVMTIALTGIASFIGAGGLGIALYRGITTNNQPLIIAGSLLIAFLALFFDFLIGLVEKSIKVQNENQKRKTKRLCIAIFIGVGLLFGSSIISLYKDKAQINIASKPMTEQYIIANMLKSLIEQDLGVNVSLTLGVGGGTANIQPAMQKGDFDIYPEYSGTGWNAVLKEPSTYNENKFDELKSRYEDKFDMTWISPYGFNNTFGIAISKEIAQKYGIKTYSDLAKYAHLLNFGAEYDFFERKDGYKGLLETYGMKFKDLTELDVGLKYDAILQGKVDVINVFTTDARLDNPKITLLSDDKGFYPSYLAMNVARNEILVKYPRLIQTLRKLDGLIDNQTMSSLNAKVEIKGEQPQVVANEFLRKKGLLK